MKIIAALVVLLCMAAAQARGDDGAPPGAPERYDGHRVVRVRMRDQRDLRTMLALSDDPWTCGFSQDVRLEAGAPVDFRVTPGQFDALCETGIPFEVLIGDVQALIDAERASIARPPLRGNPSWFADYKNLADVSAYANTLAALRPDLVTRVELGTLPSGKSIYAVRICSRPVGQPALPGVLAYSAQHAREWITVMAAMYTADKLVRGYGVDPAITRLVDSVEFWVLPVANPDGYEYTWTNQRLWRKNRRLNGDGSYGVDINRNWGYQFGGVGSSGSTSSETYRGVGPFSETETGMIRDFVIARPNLVWAIDVHSYGQLILEPWGYTHVLPRDTRTFGAMSDANQRAMFQSLGGGVYRAGECYRTIYPVSGGSLDWMYGAGGVLGTSYELRDLGNTGFVLPASMIGVASEECWAGIRSGAEWLLAHPVTASFPAARPEWLFADASTTVRVQFSRGSRRLADLAVIPPTVHWRLGRVGAFNIETLTSTESDEAGPVFQHDLIAGVCGSVVQWYYTAPLEGGGAVTIPSSGPSKPFEATARTGATAFADDFESSKPWTVGDPSGTNPDSGSTGRWTRVDPNGTTGQNEYDRTPGVGSLCFVTGDSSRGTASGNEVNGKTTLVSPVFNLRGASAAEVSFWLWFSNARQFSPDDPLIVDVTSNGQMTTPAWTRLLTIAPTAPPEQTAATWKRYTLRLDGATPLGENMRLRVVAVDVLVSHVVEAGVDDVVVTAFACVREACRADANGDGISDINDIFAYLNMWFSRDAWADADANGDTSIDDIFVFLDRWFMGCP